jgi:hypothetical protein
LYFKENTISFCSQSGGEFGVGRQNPYYSIPQRYKDAKNV